MPVKAGSLYAVTFRINHRRRGILDRPLSRTMTDVKGCEPTPPPSLKILLNLRTQPVAQIGARHGEGDVGAKKSGLRAAIVPFADEFHPVKALRFGKPDHGVGELDLAAGAALLFLQDLENFRL